MIEKREHGFSPETKIVKQEIIPDLLYYSLALAKIFKVDLQKAFLKRLENNRKKVTSWKKEKSKI